MAILISGWATKVRHGFSQRRWCRLVGRALFYSIKERGEHLGAILLQGADVSAHQQADESDNEEASDSAKMNYCLQINCDQGKYFFLFQSEEIRDKWSYFCMMASGRVPLDVGKQSSEPSNPQSPPTLRALVPSEPSSYPQSPRRTLRALVPSNPRTLAPSEPSYSQSPRTLVPSYPQSPRTLRALVPSEPSYPRTLAPSYSRTLVPSHPRTLIPSYPSTYTIVPRHTVLIPSYPPTPEPSNTLVPQSPLTLSYPRAL